MDRQTTYKPIGVFDSGFGGLTVLKEIVKEMPQYDYLYLGDNARAPYGTRSFETVYQYTLECVNQLFDKGCHLVILACNTASAQAFGKAWDVWRTAMANPNSAEAKLQARFNACSTQISRASYDTYQ